MKKTLAPWNVGSSGKKAQTAKVPKPVCPVVGIGAAWQGRRGKKNVEKKSDLLR